ncbi:hypothetical protein QG37_05864 [Candidozyma auris]|uniref:Uncharacterized protein n=1 Tax=Candidozyma auris TaxID=498019 RepID=A0A0L0NTW3_CANAR|nr:hypothetical protein QG37_05864 [[Candida] auris]
MGANGPKERASRQRRAMQEKKTGKQGIRGTMCGRKSAGGCFSGKRASWRGVFET